MNSTADQNMFSSPAASMQQGGPLSADVTAILGFSIETLAQIQAQMASMPSSTANINANATAATVGALSKAGPDPTLLAERIVKNLFNYVSGFVPGGSGVVTPDSVVPMGVIAKWYEKFLGKIKAGGVGFLENNE